MKTFQEFILEASMKGFIDPFQGKTPSGKIPYQNVLNKSKSARNKAVRGFLNQYGKKHGGKWAAHIDDNGNIDFYKSSRNF
jgi:hypothetical protein